MTPPTRRDVLAHQTAVPWPSQRQVEQDLLLCRAMAALFSENSCIRRSPCAEARCYTRSTSHRGFCSDMDQLLHAGAVYDPWAAGVYLRERLLSLLPER